MNKDLKETARFIGNVATDVVLPRPPGDPEDHAGTKKKTSRLKQTVWYGGNLLLPLFETRMTIRAVRYLSVTKLAQIRELRRLRKEENQQYYSFDEALAASGRTREDLLARYCFGKRLWLMLFIPGTLLSLFLLAAMLANASDLKTIGWWRTGSMLLVLTSFSALMFCGALKSAYRLWQLRTEKLGTFQEWRATGRWLRDTLGW